MPLAAAAAAAATGWRLSWNVTYNGLTRSSLCLLYRFCSVLVTNSWRRQIVSRRKQLWFVGLQCTRRAHFMWVSVSTAEGLFAVFNIFMTSPPLERCSEAFHFRAVRVRACVCDHIPTFVNTISLLVTSSAACGNFARFINSVQFGTKMSWLGFEIKSSKVKVTARPYMVK